MERYPVGEGNEVSGRSIRLTPENLPFFEALASETRLRLLERLAEGECNIKELAASLGLSSAIITRHVRQLEDAGFLQTRMIREGGAIQKRCSVAEGEFLLQMPVLRREEREYQEISIPVGQFTDCQVRPTCGLASEIKVIGAFDDPRCFFLPERTDAQILWFGRGYVEYRIPNGLRPDQEAEELEISCELSSEAPGYRDDWPSDITFWLNGRRLCTWTSAGDFGEQRGRLTPDWWHVNQYGVLKTVRLREDGVYLDGARFSREGICSFGLQKESWTLRFSVEEDAHYIGGCTLYGERFGNYPQNILVRTACRPRPRTG